MKQFWLIALCVGLCVGLALSLSWRAPAISNTALGPGTDENYTSSREIDRLRLTPDGVLWAFTGGGVLRFQNGVWTKFGVAPREAEMTEESEVQWRGQVVTKTLDGLQLGDGERTRIVTLPPSSGTHISALLPRGAVLWVAVFGDGIWQWNGKNWTQPTLKLPPKAREITSLAGSNDGKTVWLGTRRQGVWSLENEVWKQHLQPDEPYAHNVQFLQEFQDSLWASTLEDGLIVRDDEGWKHFGRGVLSSNAPRQMAVFQSKLYVRHSNEVVDCFDGQTWVKNVFPDLPRKQIISMAADDRRLYLGQWGGWSEWDGKRFSHHLKIPELQIVPLMQIFPDVETLSSDKLWLGTENRGLFEWDIDEQKLRHYDERHGLPDDWITSFARNGTVLFAGTFNGGIAWREQTDSKWHSASMTNRLGITSIVGDGAQRTFIATRFGLYCRDDKGKLQAWNGGLSHQEREIQALLQTSKGLWIGTRTGLLFRRRSTLNRPQTKISELARADL